MKLKNTALIIYYGYGYYSDMQMFLLNTISCFPEDHPNTYIEINKLADREGLVFTRRSIKEREEVEGQCAYVAVSV